jgi:hypothetical protein
MARYLAGRTADSTDIGHICTGILWFRGTIRSISAATVLGGKLMAALFGIGLL